MLALESGAFGLSVVLLGTAVWLHGHQARAVQRAITDWAQGHGWRYEARTDDAGGTAVAAVHDLKDRAAKATHHVAGRLGAGPFTLTSWRARRAPVGRPPRRAPLETLVVTVQTDATCPGFHLQPRRRFQATPAANGPASLMRRREVFGVPDAVQQIASDQRLVGLLAALPASARIDWTDQQLILRIDGVPPRAASWHPVLSMLNTFAVRGGRRLAAARPSTEQAAPQRPLAVGRRRPVAVVRAKPMADVA